ncbi:hypothetical protein [Pseudomonas sp. SWRI99]|uniref:hypothetical protein n=1 Tax=Pseudomonas sp. SWRI99 TaxID=2745506 RepID=UPI001648E01F|nr:hypothetical protein [Pseudomonas sp. SWRI99]MBC3777968.1 hypothetical protein [Pseudomonas sp. SWRI99]
MFAKRRAVDSHPLDPWVKWLANRTFIYLLALASLVAGVSLSIWKGDWTMLNRFGAVIAVAGLLFTMAPVFANGFYRSQSGAGRYGDLQGDDLVTTTPSERRAGSNVAAGIAVSIVGALINAFGDLGGSWLYSFWPLCKATAL